MELIFNCAIIPVIAQQKPSIRPPYPTLQAHHFNTEPCSPFPGRGLLTPWITMGGLPPSSRLQPRPVNRPARGPCGPLPGSRPLHGSRYAGIRPGVSVRTVEPGNLCSAIAPPSPCQIGRF